jgi:glucose-1-phosphate cytidylyltransferase
MNHQIPVIILAGGLGTRLSEETDLRPKPMVKIGTKPILWHLMRIYATQGFKNFLIATGYKHEVIDAWIEQNNIEGTWGFECHVESVFTGTDTQTSGRIRKVISTNNADRYMLTYGDGLADVNLQQLLKFHLSHGKIATVTSVRPPARFGHIESMDGLVTHFGEKNQVNVGWINGGFFVIEPEIIAFLKDDNIPFEQAPMSSLVSQEQLMTSQHHGFWQPMDTLREKELLAELAASDAPPWDFH